MKRELFNLENLILAVIFTALLAASIFVASCNMPEVRQGLESISESRNDRDRDRDDDRGIRQCEDRYSCADSCDFMFRSSRARSDCYQIEISDVHRLEEVFDAISDSTVTEIDLEDLDPDYLNDFLELDVGAFVDVVMGNDDSRDEEYSVAEAKTTLKWIADEEDISDVIQDLDDDSEILTALFKRLGDRSGDLSFSTKGPGGRGGAVVWTDSKIDFSGNSDDLSLSGIDKVREFVRGFVGVGDGFGSSDESFSSYSIDNESALDLAHRSAIRFCEDATGDSLEDDDEEVKQCLQGLYCSIGSNEDDNFTDSPSRSFIFDRVLRDHTSIFGNTDGNKCEISKLGDKDTFDNDRDWR